MQQYSSDDCDGTIRSMDLAEPASIEQSIVESWALPIRFTRRVSMREPRADVLAVRDGTDRQFLDKLVYDLPERAEVGSVRFAASVCCGRPAHRAPRPGGPIRPGDGSRPNCRLPTFRLNLHGSRPVRQRLP